MEDRNELSHTLGKIEAHLESIDEKLDGIAKNEERIRSLEQSRAKLIGYKAVIVGIMVWLGYDNVGQWFS